jgi:hypothetical protein
VERVERVLISASDVAVVDQFQMQRFVRRGRSIEDCKSYVVEFETMNSLELAAVANAPHELPGNGETIAVTCAPVNR